MAKALVSGFKYLTVKMGTRYAGSSPVLAAVNYWSGGEWVTQYGVITKVLYAGSNPVLTTMLKLIS